MVEHQKSNKIRLQEFFQASCHLNLQRDSESGFLSIAGTRNSTLGSLRWDLDGWWDLLKCRRSRLSLKERRKSGEAVFILKSADIWKTAAVLACVVGSVASKEEMMKTSPIKNKCFRLVFCSSWPLEDLVVHSFSALV